MLQLGDTIFSSKSTEVTSTDDKLQTQRFELKYIIEERTAVAIRDFVSCYLDMDEHGATFPNLSYPVHSLYLDSTDLKLYQATINGDKNRYKLRLRFYDKQPGSPVYFEIKRRMNNTIAKERGGVRRAAVKNLLSGHLPEPADLLSQDNKQLVALQHFCQLMGELQAQPRSHVAYLREAWISRYDNSVRVTMDREIRTETDPTVHLSTDLVNPVLVFPDLVVLELKFTGRFPDWFGDLVRIFGLVQCGAAKYADGVTRLGAYAVSRAFTSEDCTITAQERLLRVERIGVSSVATPALASQKL